LRLVSHRDRFGGSPPGELCCRGGTPESATRWAQPLSPRSGPGRSQRRKRESIQSRLSRQNRKALTTWQDAIALKQLKAIADEQGVRQQKAIAEALNLLFTKHSRPAIATQRGM
jgi:hypothetical protein